MMMFGIIILWIGIGMIIEYKAEKKRSQQKKARKRNRRVCDYCVYEEDYFSEKSA